MKKKTLSLLLALSMLVSMFTGIPVYAEGEIAAYKIIIKNLEDKFVSGAYSANAYTWDDTYDEYGEKVTTPLTGELTESATNDYYMYTPGESDVITGGFYIEIYASGYDTITGYIDATTEETTLTAYANYTCMFEGGTDSSDETVTVNFVTDSYVKVDGEWEWFGGNNTTFAENKEYKVVATQYIESDEDGNPITPEIEYEPIEIYFTGGNLDSFVFPEGNQSTAKYVEEGEYYTVSLVFDRIPTILHTIKAVSAADAETDVSASYSLYHTCCDTYSLIASGSVSENSTVKLQENHQYNVDFTLNDKENYDNIAISWIDFTAGTEDVFVGTHNEIQYAVDENTITIAYAPFDGMPEGDAEVTVNFKDRDGNPMKVITDAEYMYYNYYDEYSGRSIYEMSELSDTLTLSGLGDGEYEIGAIWEIEEGRKGYNLANGYCSFNIENGQLDEYTIYASNGDVSNINVESGSFDLTVASHEVGGLVKVPGFIDNLAWVIKDSAGEVVINSEETEHGFLELGTYTFNIVEEEDFKELVNYPDAGISFEVKETAVDWDNEYCDWETGEVEWYPVLAESEYDVSIFDNGTARYIEWNLESTETVEVKTKISTTDGTNFADGVSVRVVYDHELDGTVTVFEETLSTETSVFEKTVTAATKRAIWNEATEEAEGYYSFFANEYRVEGTDQYGNEIYFTKNSDGIWEATVAGAEASTYSINIDSYENGSIELNKYSAAAGETIKITATPDEGYELESITVTDGDGNTVETSTTFAVESVHGFVMPASDVTVSAVFTEESTVVDPEPDFETPFTVKAEVVETIDVDDTDEGIDVYANDTVTVNVTVNGSAFTNADWTLLYDSSKFEYVSETLHTNAQKVVTGNNVLGGVIRGAAVITAGDEYEDGTVVATYVFTALPQKNDEVTGIFKITDAHANTYTMAGDLNNWPANKEDTEATILLVDEDAAATIPTGSIEAAEKEYNALEQSGNEYVLDAEFEEATVTYAIVDEAGNAVTDTNGDGSTADEIAALTYKTGLPTWKNVGTYTYYVKISGDGLATIYDSTTLKITPATLTPSATFAVDPAVDKVTIIPELQGVLDGSHNGKVTVKYTDKDGAEQTATLEASDFIYDGESTSVYNGVIEVEAQESGIFTVTLDYTKGENDNYTGEENTASVDVDKLTADDETIKALEDAIESVFPYDSVEHYVEIGELPEGWTYETPVDAYDETITDPSVTNVGDERLVKVVFTDTTNVYNDVIVYVVLKVTPAKALIDIYDQSKAVGEEDPEFTYNVQVLNDEGNVVIDGGLYTDEELAALEIETVRTPGETAGPYTITASYVPNANYEIEVYNGTLTIGAPSTEGPDADVKIEIVDLSNEADGTPDYVAGKRLVLVYTNLDKAYYGYGTADNYEKMFDVTGAGYKYVDNIYADNQLTTVQEDTEYAHVYGIVVDKITDFEATEEHEKLYRDNVIFLGSDAADAPENIVYDADINMTGELDVNDYSMNNGIYNINNINYDRVTYMKSILKADYDHSKAVDTDDSRAVKNIVDTAKVVTE